MDARLGAARAESARLHRSPSGASVAELAARFVAITVARSIEERGACRLALAGGSTPRALYERLAAPDLADTIDWARVSIFFGDERLVPPEDPSSNYRMTREALLARVRIPAENVHRIEGEAQAAVAVARYAARLGSLPLDLVLLGMGDDGHVASLFPASAELTSGLAVQASYAPIAPHERVTIGLGVINRARVVALLVTGAAKASRVAQVLTERREGRPALPAARVAPDGGELHWFLDDAAAAELDASVFEAQGLKERVS